ncbi:MAG TPA: ATP-dependent endonuclease, partial [Pasteurellaceae bacterium]|nr:ATP-dependent endonuclease [Pasteurellaceae bacterium]
MYLRQLDIAGFRGIQRLSIMLRPNMVLIGENAWGKSSLLAALSLILNPRKTLYRFTADDFYILSEENGSGKHITLLFTFSESNPTEQQTALTQPYHSLFVPHEDDFARIYLRVTGDQEGEEVITTYSFLDENGEPIDSINTEELAYQLILHHPAYRFRDARLNHNKADLRPMQIKEEDETLAKEFQAVAQLLQYYFISHKWESNLMLDTTVLWEQAKSLCLKLQQDDSGQLQKSLARAISSLFIGGENIPVDKFTRTILLFEDLDA